MSAASENGRHNFFDRRSGSWWYRRGVLVLFLVAAGLYAVQAVAGARPLVNGGLAAFWLAAAVGHAVGVRRSTEPVVSVDDQGLVWRRWPRPERRFAWSELRLEPGPFDLTVIRLRSPDGVELRIASERLDGADKLETLLHSRLERER